MNINYQKELIQDIKNKKELKNLDDSFVSEKLNSFFENRTYEQEKQKIISKLNNSKSYKQFMKSKEHDFLLKSIRAELRTIYGVFIDEHSNKKEELLKEKKYKEILNLHQSTKERIKSYDEIYKQIFNMLKKNSDEKIKNKKISIMDLACGLNPISAVFIKEKINKYFASDISKSDCNFLNEFFKIEKIDGNAVAYDLTKSDDVDKISKLSKEYDVCFLFKTLDSIEFIEWGLSEKLIEKIHSKFIVVSFPTLSIGGKKTIDKTKRKWFEDLLILKEYKYKTFEVDTELFYFVKNKDNMN